MRFARWIVRIWAAVSMVLFILLALSARKAAPGGIVALAVDGILMAGMIFLMTVEAR